jgi:hypothetical protein
LITGILQVAVTSGVGDTPPNAPTSIGQASATFRVTVWEPASSVMSATVEQIGTTSQSGTAITISVAAGTVSSSSLLLEITVTCVGLRGGSGTTADDALLAYKFDAILPAAVTNQNQINVKAL